MKKLYFTAIIFMLLTQVSNSQNDPTKLAKVVYSYQTLNFNSLGLLSEVRKADGTLHQDFTYDANNNFIQFRDYSYSTVQTATFGYTDNRISMYNGLPLTYVAENNSLEYHTEHYNDPAPTDNEDDPINRGIEWILNEEGYPIEKNTLHRNYDGDYSWQIFYAHITDGNLTSRSIEETSSWWEHVNVSNPLKAACMPVCKILVMMSDATNIYLSSDFYSKHLDVSVRYFSEDPESSQVFYELNANGLPFKKFRRHFYHGIYENTTLEATYYYQGDDLP